ncbi:phage tail protein [Sphingomonas sp.]|uniref:phage tail protein n=1 Tax=Sphingomonas sp. TaxID=28214 RepID=UPI002C893B85|nr:tail fiber protein [Sphingomonas sp.]HWK34796.1 tail fiber protein [Sphingomonas sp.]
MADPFVAEIRIFGFNFPPQSWAYCSGQLLPISQNTALFSLLGTNYGGNGQSTFGLPNLQGSTAIGSGAGAGLSERFLGEQAGSATTALLAAEIPGHNHALNAINGVATTSVPSTTSGLSRSRGGNAYGTGAPGTMMAPITAGVTGSAVSHNNMMPYLTLNYCIALQGIFPPRS